MVAGEAGIGKTRTLREFAVAARERGAVILWGSSFEGDWHPPYGPWVEALGDLIRSLDPGRLRQALGRGGPVMARLVPELDATLGECPQVAALSPGSSARPAGRHGHVLLPGAPRGPRVVVRTGRRGSRHPACARRPRGQDQRGHPHLRPAPRAAAGLAAGRRAVRAARGDPPAAGAGPSRDGGGPGRVLLAPPDRDRAANRAHRRGTLSGLPEVLHVTRLADQVACCGHARRRLTVCQWRTRNPRRRAAMRWCQVVTCVREMTIGIAWSSCCGLPRVMAG